MFVGAPTTRAYSVFGSKYIGEAKVALVGIEASFDKLISWDVNVTLASGDTNLVVGVPISIVLISTKAGTSGSSIVAKYMSTEVTYAPNWSTLNDCANGSSFSSACGGAGTCISTGWMIVRVLSISIVCCTTLVTVLSIVCCTVIVLSITFVTSFVTVWSITVVLLIITGGGGGGGGGGLRFTKVRLISLCIVVVSSVVTLTSVCTSRVVPTAV